MEINYKNRLGEIDIIAEEDKIICFVEVKSRSQRKFGLPKEAVNRPKQRKISQSAVIYLKERRLLEQGCRFDVVSVTREAGEPADFELIKDAFDLDPQYSY